MDFKTVQASARAGCWHRARPYAHWGRFIESLDTTRPGPIGCTRRWRPSRRRTSKRPPELHLRRRQAGSTRRRMRIRRGRRCGRGDIETTKSRILDELQNVSRLTRGRGIPFTRSAIRSRSARSGPRRCFFHILDLPGTPERRRATSRRRPDRVAGRAAVESRLLPVSTSRPSRRIFLYGPASLYRGDA